MRAPELPSSRDRRADARVRGVERSVPVGLGAFSRLYGSLRAGGGSGRRRDERFAEVGGAGSWACEEVAACAVSGSSRCLFADVFGLVRFVADRADVDTGGDEAGGSEELDEGWDAGSGAIVGIVKRVPKSVSLT